MCGIFGVVASKATTMTELKPLNGFIADALIMGTVRGEDSTGLMQARKDGKLLIHKLPVDGFTFSTTARAKSLVTNVDISTVTIGHHRAATKGAISAENCHPFTHVYGNRKVTGVHNGTINNDKREEDGITFDVDSDWLYYRIAKLGAQEALRDIYGAITLLWYENDGKVRMYSNQQRPLSFAFVKDKDVMLTMSEHQMLYSIASRNNIALEKTILSPTNDKKIIVFDPKDIRKFETEDVLERKIVREFIREKDKVSADEESDPWSNYYGKRQEKSPYTRMTSQGEIVSHANKEVKTLCSMNIGDKVEFFYDSTSGDTSHSTLFGEAWDGEENIQRAAMLDVSAEVKNNIRNACTLNGPRHQIICTVIGSTHVTANGERIPAVVVGQPDKIVTWDEFPQKKDEKDTTTALREAASPEDSEDARGTISLIVPGPGGRSVSSARFRELTKDGCAYCSGALFEKDAEKIVWMGVPESPVCEECALTIASELSETAHAYN